MSRVAVVTGAARGIGAAVVDELVQSGYRVVAVDRCRDLPGVPYALARPEDLEAVVARHGEVVAGLVGDVRSRADMELAVDTAVERFGQLDVVVAAAGVLAGGGPVHEASDEALEAVWSVNVLGVHRLISAAVPVLQARGASAHPRIVAVASSAAHQALYHLAAYSAAKQAVVGLVRGTARDLAPYGITANVVSPGSTRTAMLVASAALYGLGSVEEFAGYQALGRLLEPPEVAAAIAWLCSPAASGITGADLPVDGGPVG